METTAAAHGAESGRRDLAFQLLVIQLFAAHSVANKVGYQDLASVVEDRITWAAQRSSDPLMGGVATWTRTTSMLANGAYDVGLRLLDQYRDDLAVRDVPDEPTMRRVLQPLHLRSAMLAARAVDADAAHEHLDEARRLAEHAGDADGDGGWYQLTHGPSNIAIHDVAVWVELGDGGRAVHDASRLQLGPDVPRIRGAQHYVDLARAQLWEGGRPRRWIRCTGRGSSPLSRPCITRRRSK